MRAAMLLLLFSCYSIFSLSGSVDTGGNSGGGAPTTTPTPIATTTTGKIQKSPLKSGMGKAHHYAEHGRRRYEERGYGREGYGGGYRHHHLVDDFICDLDASILVVTNRESGHGYGKEEKREEYGEKKERREYESGESHSREDYSREKRGSYGDEEEYSREDRGRRVKREYREGEYEKDHDYGVAIAHRLRCSLIATKNDSDCTTCCQLAARRDRSVSRESIVGFIIDHDQVRHAEHGRVKRDSTGAHPPSIQPPQNFAQVQTGGQPAATHAQHENYNHPAPPTYNTQRKVVVQQPKKYAETRPEHHNNAYQHPGGYEKYGPVHLPFPPRNARCVCCAPKHRQNYEHRRHNGYERRDYGYGGREEYGRRRDEGYGRREYGDNYGYEREYGPFRRDDERYERRRYGYGGGFD